MKKKKKTSGEKKFPLIDSASNIATARWLADARHVLGLPLAGRVAWRRWSRTETEGRRDAIGCRCTESEKTSFSESLRDSWWCVCVLGVTPEVIYPASPPPPFSQDIFKLRTIKLNDYEFKRASWSVPTRKEKGRKVETGCVYEQEKHVRAAVLCVFFCVCLAPHRLK